MDGQKIFTGSAWAGTRLSVWDAITGQYLYPQWPIVAGIWDLIPSLEGGFVLSVERGGTVEFYDSVTGTNKNFPFYPLRHPVDASEPSYAYRGFACVQGDIASADITRNGKLIAIQCGVAPPVEDLCAIDLNTVAENQRQMIEGDIKSACGIITLYSTETWKSLGELKSYPHKSGGISFNRDGGILAFGVDQGGLRVEFWSTLGMKKVHTLDGFSDIFYRVKFSSDGRLLLIETADGQVELWGVKKP